MSSSTPESPQPSSVMTSSGSVTFCPRAFLTNIPDASKQPSQTSEAASTSRGPDFYAFWDSSNRELYRQLSWLHETGLPDLGSSSSSGSALSTEQISWFSTLKTVHQKKNSEKTSCPSCRFTVVDGMADAATQPPESIKKTLKLKLKPTPEQKKKLNQWAGCVRFTYNKAVNLLLKPKSTQRDAIRLQNRLVIKTTRRTKAVNSFIASRPWLEECPTAIRKYAVRDAVANLKACRTNRKRGNITHFKPPFRRKRVEQLCGWSMTLEKKNVKAEAAMKNSKKSSKKFQEAVESNTKIPVRQLFIYKKLLGEMRYCGCKQLNKLLPARHPEDDPKLQKDRFGDYYLVLSYTVPTKPLPQTVSKPVAGDPGVRKYLATYSPDGEAKLYGNRWASKIMELALQVDRMQGEASSLAGRARYRHTQRMKHVRKRIHNLKNELRCQIANDLVRNVDAVLLPKLSVKDLVVKATRKLTTKTARSLLAAGHGMFFERVQYKCAERGVWFLQVTEQYTSQTCPECGALNKCDEIYKCRQCGFKHDRDLVGSLNILLRAVRRDAPVATAT
jgi:putative transposase